MECTLTNLEQTNRRRVREIAEILGQRAKRLNLSIIGEPKATTEQVEYALGAASGEHFDQRIRTFAMLCALGWRKVIHLRAAEETLVRVDAISKNIIFVPTGGALNRLSLLGGGPSQAVSAILTAIQTPKQFTWKGIDTLARKWRLKTLSVGVGQRGVPAIKLDEGDGLLGTDNFSSFIRELEGEIAVMTFEVELACTRRFLERVAKQSGLPESTVTITDTAEGPRVKVSRPVSQQQRDEFFLHTGLEIIEEAAPQARPTQSLNDYLQSEDFSDKFGKVIRIWWHCNENGKDTLWVHPRGDVVDYGVFQILEKRLEELGVGLKIDGRASRGRGFVANPRTARIACSESEEIDRVAGIVRTSLGFSANVLQGKGGDHPSPPRIVIPNVPRLWMRAVGFAAGRVARSFIKAPCELLCQIDPINPEGVKPAKAGLILSMAAPDFTLVNGVFERGRDRVICLTSVVPSNSNQNSVIGRVYNDELFSRIHVIPSEAPGDFCYAAVMGRVGSHLEPQVIRSLSSGISGVQSILTQLSCQVEASLRSNGQCVLSGIGLDKVSGGVVRIYLPQLSTVGLWCMGRERARAEKTSGRIDQLMLMGIDKRYGLVVVTSK